MRVVFLHQGVLSIRWPWLPFWLAINPILKEDIGQGLQDRVLLGGLTTSDDDLDAMHNWVLDRIEERFPAFDGLRAFLDGMRHVQPGA